MRGTKCKYILKLVRLKQTEKATAKKKRTMHETKHNIETARDKTQHRNIKDGETRTSLSILREQNLENYITVRSYKLC